MLLCLSSGTDLQKSRHVLKSLSLCNKVLSYLSLFTTPTTSDNNNKNVLASLSPPTTSASKNNEQHHCSASVASSSLLQRFRWRGNRFSCIRSKGTRFDAMTPVWYIGHRRLQPCLRKEKKKNPFFTACQRRVLMMEDGL